MGMIKTFKKAKADHIAEIITAPGKSHEALVKMHSRDLNKLTLATLSNLETMLDRRTTSRK